MGKLNSEQQQQPTKKVNNNSLVRSYRILYRQTRAYLILLSVNNLL